MQVGYARVSTRDQNLALQQEALNKAGCEKIYEDRVSGKKTARQGLDLALEVLREGDSLVVVNILIVRHKAPARVIAEVTAEGGVWVFGGRTVSGTQLDKLLRRVSHV